MFKFIKKLFRISPVVWFVEGWDCEHDVDYGSGHMTGPFKTEQNAMDYAKKHYDDGLWNCDLMWRP